MGLLAHGHETHYWMTTSLWRDTAFPSGEIFRSCTNSPFAKTLWAHGFALQRNWEVFTQADRRKLSKCSLAAVVQQIQHLVALWRGAGPAVPKQQDRKAAFIARLFLLLYFCPSCCQQILAGISIAVLNQCLAKAQAGWTWTSSMELHWCFSIFLI